MAVPVSTKMALYVDQGLVRCQDASFVQKQIVARAAYLALATLSPITCAVETLVGLGAGVGCVVSLGTNRRWVQFSNRYLESARELVAATYLNLLGAINPSVRFPACVRPDEGESISRVGNGLLAATVVDALHQRALRYTQENDRFSRHVTSRLTFSLLAISCLVTRSVDAVIGLPTGLASVVTAGRFNCVNNLAYRALQTAAIVKDLFVCSMGIINPYALVAAEGKYSATALLRACNEDHSNPRNYRDALALLKLDESPTVEEARQHRQTIIADLKQRMQRASAPIASVLQTLVEDVNIAFETVVQNMS